MSFCTAINCMDGRVQLPVNEYLRGLLGIEFVDTITEAGPVRLLVHEQQSHPATSILSRVNISINKHASACVAIVAHWDCAGNPVSEHHQKEQLKVAVRFIATHYPNLRVLGLWVDDHWLVHHVCSAND